MKHVLFILLVICLCFGAKAQTYPVNQNLGSSSTLVQVPSPGGLRAGLVPIPFTDSTAANAVSYLKNTPGIIIRTTSDGKLLKRNEAITKWEEVGAASVNIYNSDGIITGNRTVNVGGTGLTFTGGSEFEVTNMSNEVRIGTSSSNRMRFSNGVGAYVSFDMDTIYFPRLLASGGVNTERVLVLNAQDKLKYRSIASLVSGSAWSLTGNSGTSKYINFLGTTDNTEFNIRVGDTASFRLTKLGTDPVLGQTATLPQSIYIGRGAGKKDTTSGIYTNIGIGPYALSSYDGSLSANNAGGNIAIGFQSQKDYIGSGSENNVSVGFRSLRYVTTGYRNVAVGLNTLHNLTVGLRNTGIGTFAGEWSTLGNDNTFVGESSARNHTIGNFNAAVGNSASYYNTGSITSTVITNGGLFYTTATVTFSAPDTPPFGFNPSIQATGTAILSGGSVVGITITEMGVGYTHATCTITGDGTGATASAAVTGASYNSSLGATSLYSNRVGTGNVGIGFQSGYGDGTNSDDRRIIDNFNTYVGIYATARGANPTTTAIEKSTAIGYNAIVGKSKAIVLGATGTDQPDVAIGTQIPIARLHVVGSGKFTDTLHADGTLEAKRAGVTDIIPTTGFSFMDQGEVKIAHRSGADAGLSIYRAQAANFGGAAINFYRTNSNDLNVKTALVSTQSLWQLQGLAVAGDNSTLDVGALERVRANGTPRSTYVPSFWEMQLRDTFGTLNTNFRVYPYGTVVGEDAGSIAVNPSAQLEVRSTLRGTLFSRMNTTQMNAIASPAAGLIIWNTDSTALCTYDGSIWSKLLNSVATRIPVNQIAVGNGTGITSSSNFTWNGTTFMLGNFSVTGTATPVTMNSGATYGTNTAGTPGNLKWRLFDDNAGSTYGFGISVGRLEYQAGAAAAHVFYNNGSEVFRLHSTGNASFGGNATPASLLSVGSTNQFQVNSSGKIPAYASTAPTNGKLLIGHTANGTFELGNIASSNSSITVTNNAGGIDLATAVTLAAGSTTPTVTNGSNVDASTVYEVHWTRVGNTVTFSGTIDVDATAIGAAFVQLTPPVASNFALSTDAAGTLIEGVAGAVPQMTGFVTANTVTDKLAITLTAQSTSSRTYYFTGSYKVL